MNKPNEPAKATPLVEQIAEQAAEELWTYGDRTTMLRANKAIIRAAMNQQGVAITLTRGKFAVVSPEDADLSVFEWHCTSHGRAAKGNSEYLHKLIGERMGLSGEIDHRDGNPLNNRRSNLRSSTRTQNQANTPKHLTRGNTSKFKGVSRSRTGKPWQAQIKQDGKCKYLGRFDNEEDAARAYDKAALEVFGEFAKTNFDSAAQPQRSERTHHNTCPRGERCACYLTGYTEAEYDHGLALDELPASGAASGEREPFDKFIAKVQATGEPPKEERGEAQEWTGSIGGLITASNKPIAVALDIDNAKAIADAHNAALAAERQKVAWCEPHEPTATDPITCCPCCEAVHERQKREQAEDSAKAWEDDSRAGKEIQKGLHAELLAALAAIEKIKSIYRDWFENATAALDGTAPREHLSKSQWAAIRQTYAAVLAVIPDVNPTALEQHDAELRSQWEKEHEQSK